MLTVTEATTEELRQKAYELRYEVFFKEEGDARYADHANEIWIDRDDVPHSKLIVCQNESGDVVGTLRLTCLKDWSFIAHEAYDFTLLASILNMDESDVRSQIARSDRGVVSASYRGKGVVSLMDGYFEKLAQASGCPILVGIPGVDNAASRRAFGKLGWIEYPSITTWQGFTGQHIYKDLRGR